ncbi:MAG: D-aminoacylase [Chloroflexi bacterium]|nr:D-aminoacylase [Chloroflexota bacterium]MCI0804116.1 D-aminoacylase [Chloroflexota bacterium]MCI0871534.1 D-aminoacylase [Chloroflexota bacterium]
MFDVVIRGGMLIDGSGTPGYPADMAIAGDAIVAIGKPIEGEARRTIDATGKVVAPGFIDLHSHADFSFFVDPDADSKITQGVTFEYVGNCGISFCAPLIGDSGSDLETRKAWYDTEWAPDWTGFDGFLDALAKNGSTLNIATQVGHGTVRRAVMGMDTRAPGPGELRQMQTLVAEGLDAGALGFSSGLSMAPGFYSLAGEVFDLVQIAADRGKLYSTHMRDSSTEGPGLFVATMEALEAGRRTGASVQVSHLKANGPMRGRSGKLLEMIEEAKADGIDAAADVYPYVSASGPMSGNVFPRWALEGGRDEALKRLQDADLRAQIVADLEKSFAKFTGPAQVAIANYAPDATLEGKRLTDVASDMGCGEAEALARLYEKFDAQLVITGMVQEDVDRISAAPSVAIASDGSSLRATGPLSAGKPHPRSYGTFPRFLARVRETGLVSLEEAIRKMTTLPAGRLSLTRRGRLVPGYFADVVVFDPSDVRDMATFERPHEYSEGIEQVLVNGTPVVSDGKTTGKRPGRVIRSHDE